MDSTGFVDFSFRPDTVEFAVLSWKFLFCLGCTCTEAVERLDFVWTWSESEQIAVYQNKQEALFSVYTPDWFLCQYVVMCMPVSVHLVSLVNLMHCLLLI